MKTPAMRLPGRQRFSSGRLGRGLIGALGLALACVLVMAMARADGFSAARLTLASGQAWVASSRVGRIALIDGSTEQKVADLTVAKPGDDISVAQGGSDALVVNRTTGSVLRVLGSTYGTAPGAVSPLPGAGSGLSVFTGNGTRAYAVDTSRGAAVVLDRSTMRVQQQSLSLAARLSPDATVIDAQGRLWAVDSASGDLVWFDGSGKHVRRGAAAEGTGTRLVLVRGEPAIVDVGRRKVSLLNPANGRTTSDSCLDVPPGAQIAAGGSSTAADVFVVSSERGVLLVSDLKSGQCSRLITLTSPGARLGDPVETGGRVFVPDYASGQVFVVDLDTGKVVADPDVLPAGLESFDLLPRAGFVFYNDRSSQRSGVIRLDGSVSRISKYNPADPSQETRRPTKDTANGQNLNGANGTGTGAGDGGDGVDGLGDNTKLPTSKDHGKNFLPPKSSDHEQSRPPNRPPRTPPPSRPPGSSGTPPTTVPATGVPITGPATPPPGTPSVPPPGRPSTPPPPDTSPPTDTTPPGNPTPPAIDREVFIGLGTGGPYLVGNPISLEVLSEGDGAPPVSSATWTFGDGTSASGVTVQHSWSDAAVYTVSVDAVLSDGSTGHAFTTLAVVLPVVPPNKPPVAKLSVSPDTGTAPRTVTADASGSQDADGSIVSYTFAWGDGKANTVTANPVAKHTYDAQCLNCDVRLIVTDDGGLTDEVTKVVSFREKTAADLSVDFVVRPGAIMVGDGVGVSADINLTDPSAEFSVDWGDGKSTPRGGPTPNHQYDKAGTFSVTVTAYAAGQEATASRDVSVYAYPRANLSVTPRSGAADLTVRANASASGGGYGDNLMYSFSWGDGETTGPQSSATAAHTYRSACTCTVKLTVNDDPGNKDTDTATVTVTDPPASGARAQALDWWTPSTSWLSL